MKSEWSAALDGRSESYWLRNLPLANLPVLDIAAVGKRWSRILVLAAHADDETLGMGGLIADLTSLGQDVELLVITDGAGSHPHSQAFDHGTLMKLRRVECESAARELGIERPVRSFNLPDSGLDRESLAPVRECLRQVCDPETLVMAPYPQDGHRDHDLLGEVAAEIALDAGAPCVFYPVWLWHWAAVTDLPISDLIAVNPSADGLDAKFRALGQYVSQTTTVGQQPGRGPVLTAQSHARGRRLLETLIDPHGVLPRLVTSDLTAKTDRTARPFDAMFDGSSDPWGVESRWYEQRRQRLIEAMLPESQLGRVLDLGCSTGVLTQALRSRAASVHAVDASTRALAQARLRNGDSVTFERGRVPEILRTDAMAYADGSYDTVVLSELGYFLTPLELAETLQQIDRLLADDGVLVAAHWQRPTREIPLNGALVDECIGHVFTIEARYVDADVALVVARRDGADRE